jgi:hypothetical protein
VRERTEVEEVSDKNSPSFFFELTCQTYGTICNDHWWSGQELVASVHRWGLGAGSVKILWDLSTQLAFLWVKGSVVQSEQRLCRQKRQMCEREVSVDT